MEQVDSSLCSRPLNLSDLFVVERLIVQDVSTQGSWEPELRNPDEEVLSAHLHQMAPDARPARAQQALQTGSITGSAVAGAGSGVDETGSGVVRAGS